MANKIIHKHSNVVTDGQAKLPTSSQLEYGELAINYADGVETISIRNSADEIIEFRSKEYVDSEISDTKDKVDTLQTDFEEHEEVVATALTVLNKKIDEFDNIVGTTVNERIESLENAFQEHEEVAAEAINDLDERVKSKSDVGHTHVSSNITGTISAASGITSNTTLLTQGKAVYNYAAPKNHTHQEIIDEIDELKSAVEDDEFVVSSAINDLDERVKSKSDVGHTHVSSNITGTISAASGITSNTTLLTQGKAVYNYAAPKNHTHQEIIDEIDELKTDFEEHEEVVATALTVLNERTNDVENSLSNVNESLGGRIDSIEDIIENMGTYLQADGEPLVEEGYLLNNIKLIDVTSLFAPNGIITGITLDDLCKNMLVYNSVEDNHDSPVKFYYRNAIDGGGFLVMDLMDDEFNIHRTISKVINDNGGVTCVNITHSTELSNQTINN